MEEMQDIQDKPLNAENAIEISNGTFAWDREIIDDLQKSSKESIQERKHSQQQQDKEDGHQQQQENGEIESLLEEDSSLVTTLFDVDLNVKKVCTFVCLEPCEY